MADFSRHELDRRLASLSDDLEQFPPGALCPWPLGRVFNELLKQAKRELAEDPIVRGMRLLEEGDPTADVDSSDALVGTVRALVTQVRLGLDPDPSRDRASVASASVSGAGS
jgi:MoxR-like ATPase